MDFDSTKIKLFASKNDKEARKQQEFKNDTQYGNPEYELKDIYLAAKYGIIPVSAVTAISTGYFIFSALYSHLQEFTGNYGFLHVISVIILGLITFGVALFVEWALRGLWKPFYKKAFISKGKKIDIVLLLGGTIFSGIVISFAMYGMFMLADSTPQVQHESTVSVNEQANTLVAAKDKEIADIKACKVKAMAVYLSN